MSTKDQKGLKRRTLNNATHRSHQNRSRKNRARKAARFPKFNCFLGVDQTGAVLSQGRRARPLQAALLTQSPRGWQLKYVSLSSLNQSEAAAALHLHAGHLARPKLALAVDCVYGFAKGITAQPMWQGLCEASTHGKGLFGRGAAEEFFAKIWSLGSHSSSEEIELPRRTCEVLSRANSVFLTRPFQKNIQTGTYRIWKDLAQDKVDGKSWLNFWPMDAIRLREGNLSIKEIDRPFFFEAYPSLVWREILGSRTRQPERLKVLSTRALAQIGLEVNSRDWAIFHRNPDAADAATIALGALYLQEMNELFEPFENFFDEPNLSEEGWIMGLKR